MRVTKPFQVLVGERLKQLREARGLSLTDAAQHLGRHRTHLWKMETGEGGVASELIPKLAELYQVDELDLLTFPALSTRHEIIDLTRGLPEEMLQPLVRECRKLARAARSSTPPQPAEADTELAWNHVHASMRAGSHPDKQPRKRTG